MPTETRESDLMSDFKFIAFITGSALAGTVLTSGCVRIGDRGVADIVADVAQAWHWLNG